MTKKDRSTVGKIALIGVPVIAFISPWIFAKNDGVHEKIFKGGILVVVGLLITAATLAAVEAVANSGK